MKILKITKILKIYQHFSVFIEINGILLFQGFPIYTNITYKTPSAVRDVL